MGDETAKHTSECWWIGPVRSRSELSWAAAAGYGLSSIATAACLVRKSNVEKRKKNETSKAGCQRNQTTAPYIVRMDNTWSRIADTLPIQSKLNDIFEKGNLLNIEFYISQWKCVRWRQEQIFYIHIACTCSYSIQGHNGGPFSRSVKRNYTAL